MRPVFVVLTLMEQSAITIRHEINIDTANTAATVIYICSDISCYNTKIVVLTRGNILEITRRLQKEIRKESK